MGCYLFQGKNVYSFADGRSDRMSWDDFMASALVEDKNAHILIAEADGPLLIEHVRQIREAFSRRAIKTCAPYAAALRMFLQKHGLIAAGESFLVADDLGDRFLLTASNRQQMALTRAIISRDPVKVVDEVRRTQKNEPIVRILSNSSQVIEALGPEQGKEAVFFGTAFPAFEVLGRVKFPSQLMPPEEFLMQKQSEMRRGFIAAWSVAAVMAALGCLFFSYAHTKEDALERKMTGLLHDKEVLEREARELGIRTYHERLKAMPSVSSWGVFARFLNCLPPESRIERASMERSALDMRWGFTGLVSFPGQEIHPFSCDIISQRAKIDHVFVQAKPGFKISYILSDAKAERGDAP